MVATSRFALGDFGRTRPFTSSSQLFGPNEIVVSPDGGFDGGHSFASHESVFTGVVTVSAVAANGTSLEGELSFG